ncbi:hypothetical protein Lesp02_14320 [Lentzea sp. NBRC 105346]|uniref:AfsR/SARP family transcriptional regulator n=1 Tax=Lentzea sp. NBRC 105346 TaxID=3032205 RepID=UPI0024A27811|nr:AfsR/SARP family transcriptional regulator [Lentzea sp. NBRC 105346]GLZ29242.1 hypothetical protein Lesp02_14320 [Lentzea sp. NBRC 105346]
MHVRILGPLELATDEGRSLTPRALKLRSLLALLSVNSERVVSADTLIDALWSGAPPRTAGTALQVYISKLRKHHEDLASDLQTKPPGYLFDLRSHQLDLRDFDSLMARARQAETSGLTEEAAELLQAALDLWTGPALADMRSLPVLDSFARQLDERRMVAHERRFELELTLGRHNTIISELHGLISEHPMWENLHYLLMLSLYRSGRTAESLKIYNRARTTLVESLGMEPSLRVQQLHRAILARAAWLDNPSLLHAS